MKSGFRKTTAMSMTETGKKQEPARNDPWQQIALAAYFKAESRGFDPGHELDDWLEAEREVMTETFNQELAA